MSMLRITGGFLRGRKVALPAHELRPTSGKARQAFFNVLADRIQDATFLDLFSGTGVFSLEAVSRGAKRALAVDQSRPAMNALGQLAREWNLPIETMTADTIGALRSMHSGPFDVVYADPPYGYPRYSELLDAIDRLPLAGDAVVGIEHDSRSRLELPETRRLVLRKIARYGTVAISVFDAAPENSREI